MKKRDADFKANYNERGTYLLRFTLKTMQRKDIIKNWCDLIDDEFKDLQERLGFNFNDSSVLRRFGHICEGAKLPFKEELLWFEKKANLRGKLIPLYTDIRIKKVVAKKSKELPFIQIDQKLITPMEVRPKMPQVQGLWSTVLSLAGHGKKAAKFIKDDIGYFKDLHESCGHKKVKIDSLTRHYNDIFAGYKMPMEKELLGLGAKLGVPYAQSSTLYTEEAHYLPHSEIMRINNRKSNHGETVTGFSLYEAEKKVTLQKVTENDKIQKTESLKQDKSNSKKKEETKPGFTVLIKNKVYGTIKTFLSFVGL